MGFCPELTHYKLTFTELKGEDGSDAPEITMRRMSLGEAIDFDALREEQPATAAAARVKVTKVAATIADGLVAWNLVNPDGSPRPTTVEGVLSLSEPVMVAIVDAWIAAMRGIPAPLGPSSTPGDPGMEASMNMEILSPNLES